MDTQKRTFKVGSRKSELALAQSKFVIAKLEELHPSYSFEIVPICTIGDKILDKPLPKIGDKGLFTKELEVALVEKKVDFVVHSLKDVATVLPENMALAAILERENPMDVLILHEKHKGKTLESLPRGSIIGTGALRRIAQLSHKYPHLKLVNIRGNLNTRLSKLDNNDLFDGIILAYAGVKRLGWCDRISQILTKEEMLYAVGQGALAVECRQTDLEIIRILGALHDRGTVLKVIAERSFLRTLGGGCSTPVAVYSTHNEDFITLDGAVWSLDGSQILRHTLKSKLLDKRILQSHIEKHRKESGEPLKKCPFKLPRLIGGIWPGDISYIDMEIAEKLGSDLAKILLDDGAGEILKAAKEETHKTVVT